MKKDVKIEFRTFDSDKKALQKLALKKGITFSGLMCMISKEYLKKEGEDA